MDVFDLRQHIVQDYANFARSFTRVKATDLKRQIDEIYAKDQFWPEPLLQITPYYEPGASLDELAASGEVTPTTAALFLTSQHCLYSCIHTKCKRLRQQSKVGAMSLQQVLDPASLYASLSQSLIQYSKPNKKTRLRELARSLCIQ